MLVYELSLDSFLSSVYMPNGFTYSILLTWNEWNPNPNPDIIKRDLWTSECRHSFINYVIYIL